jgi:hypothetical protein
MGQWDMTGVRLACHSMPMFHGMGIAQVGWTVSWALADKAWLPLTPATQATAGLVITAFKPQTPAVAPTADLVLKGAIDTSSDIVFCVPSFVEVWIRLLPFAEGMLLI